MDSGLLNLLKPCEVTENSRNAESSHFTFFGPSKKWYVPNNYYKTFWKKYCEIAFEPETNKKKLCLAEIPIKEMPIISDLTLKFHPLNTSSSSSSSNNNNDEPYNEDFILAIVYCYQQIIKETLKISESAVELICCVMKTETKMEDNLKVCRIRLQFPYCKTESQIQNRLIRPLVIHMFRTTNVIKRLPSQPVNEWEDIVDPLTVEKPIVMYGSSSSPDMPKFVLEYIFPQVSENDIDETKTRVLDISETFFPQNHRHTNDGIIKLKMFQNEDDNIDHDFWLPFFLSIYYLKEVTLPKSNNPSNDLLKGSLKNNLKGTSLKNSNSGNLKISTSKLSFNEEDKDGPEYLSSIFLGMLDKKRAEEEHYWLDVGKALYNAFEKDDRGLEKWIDFTENSDEFDAGDCKERWYKFEESNITIKTLAFYAREDSPKEYKEWHESWYLPSLEKATSCTHSDVAEAIYRVYWLEFVCTNLSKNTLYHFKNHSWKRLDSGHILKTFISGEFLTVIEKFRIDVAMQMQNTEDKNYKDSAEIMIQKICKLINKLKNRTFKNAIFSECAEKFFVDGFEEALDTDPDLMGCLNCVIQCLDKKAIVRSGKPDDRVSHSTGIYWREYSDDHPLVKRLLSYLGKVFPQTDLLKYFGKLIAATLKGRNSDKIFPIHSGKGNNSKSMIKKLCEAAYGSYSATIPVGIFTGGKSSGGAEPALARCKYVHLAFAQEPDAEISLRAGTIKEMTGGDRFFARFLHDNGSEILPMFTLNLMCNVIPIIPQCDQAIKNRVRCIPYLSTWQKDAPKNIEDQYRERKFILDPFFEKQIPELAPAFLWWLVRRMYAEYRLEGAMEPEIVRKFTASYWEENDIYSQFVKENLEKAYKLVPPDYKGEKPVDENAFITLPDLYARFKDWFKENYQLKLPDRQIFRNEMESRVTKCISRAFYGVKFKVTVADI